MAVLSEPPVPHGARPCGASTGQGLRLRRRRRLSPPAPSAGRTSGSPARGRAAPSSAVRAGECPRPPEGPCITVRPDSGPGGLHDRRPGGEPGASRSPEASSCHLPASGPRGICDCCPGGGPAHPDRRRRHLTVRRPAGRAVLMTANRAGAVRTLIARGVIRHGHLTVRRPVGRAALTTANRAGAVRTLIAGGVIVRMHRSAR